MYGDSGVMRKRAAQIREQAGDIRSMADHLVAQTEGIAWTGRAADAMRERIRDRAAHLREAAARARHRRRLPRAPRPPRWTCSRTRSAPTERKADKLVTDARARVAQIDDADDPDGVRPRPRPRGHRP